MFGSNSNSLSDLGAPPPHPVTDAVEVDDNGSLDDNGSITSKGSRRRARNREGGGGGGGGGKVWEIHGSNLNNSSALIPFFPDKMNAEFGDH